MQALNVDNVSMLYHETPVVDKVSFAVEAGTMAALVGPNGAGKSTLLKGILGLHPLAAGEVTFQGKPLDAWRRRIAYMPQHSDVNWDFPLTVGGLALMGRYPHLSWIKRPGKKDKEIAHRALELVEMTDFKDRQIAQLSGGQKQRAFLARALAQEADYYFLDEAFAGIDQRSAELLWCILYRLKQQGKTILVVHHDLKTVKERFDQVILLHRELVAEGTPEEALRDKNLVAAYGRFTS